MDVWAKALEDHNVVDANNVDADIRTDDKQLELERKSAKLMIYSTQELVIGLEIEGMILTKKNNSISHDNTSLLTEFVEDTITDALQVV